MNNLTPWTKRILIMCAAVVAVAAMYFGYFDDILALVEKVK